jgi:hypothetical protein
MNKYQFLPFEWKETKYIHLQYQYCNWIGSYKGDHKLVDTGQI